MPENDKMLRVSKKHPCPVCFKPDWCLYAKDGSAAICKRIQEGSEKKCGDAGYYHLLSSRPKDNQQDGSQEETTAGPNTTPKNDFITLQQQYSHQAKDKEVNLLSEQLGVSVQCLKMLNIGWDGKAYAFPMFDEYGNIIGIQRRFSDGHKVSVDGSKIGLFIPSNLPADGLLLICEGASDTAAALDLGFPAIGRPSCNSGVAMTGRFVKGRNVAIVGDNDEAGRSGAEGLAGELHCPSVKVIYPPEGIKDLRQWVKSGLTAEQLKEAIERSAVFKIKHVVLAKSQKIKRVLEYHPFPLKALPEPVRGFVTVTSSAIGCDPSYVALPLLAALATAIGNTRQIKLKDGWTEPPVLWTAIIGESGTMKSPAVEVPLKPLIERQAEALETYQKEKERYDTEMEVYQAKLTEWKRSGHKKGEEPPEKPEPPICQRFVCNDTTVEALADRLKNAPRGLLLFRDELAGWMQSFNQYKGGKGSDCAHWLSMHGARPLLIDRKSGDKSIIYVPRAAVCITGGIQPNILKRVLGQEHWDNGLAARMLLAMPPRKLKVWTSHGIPDEANNQLAAIFDSLLRLQPAMLTQAVIRPVDLGLTSAALKAFIDFFNDHNTEQLHLYGNEAAAWSKLEGYAARLAMILHLVKCAAGATDDKSFVDEGSMAAGIELCNWFGNETIRIYAVMQEDEDEQQLRRHCELISCNGGSISVRDWQRIRHHPSSEAARLELANFVDTGLGYWQHPKAGVEGGRPSEVFCLHGTVTCDKTLTDSEKTRVLSQSHTMNEAIGESEHNQWGVV